MVYMRVAVDLGGTNIRVARVDKGRCVEKKSVLCPAGEEASVIVDRLSGLIKELMNEEVTGIGIGVPSIVDAEKGIVYNAANIASWKEVHLKDMLEKEFQVPVAVENDCNCFALGECLYGAGQSCRNMVGVTLGTGIGAGIIIERRLYGGLYRGAGEVGSLPYLDSDYEHYCSSGFFKRLGSTGADFAQKALQGDEEASAVWAEFGKHIGRFMEVLLYTYAPDMIVLGGGISRAYPLFREAMEETMREFPYPMIVEKTNISIASLKDANLLGAASLF